ncbi:hypothetical protein ABZ313_09315 [Streptomyces sp. NPDC006251]|uniref:hypothetical protein n=1 Tax=Streptomyces sp. NPDC006251 TaxID=3155718 RepID=UPI0033A718BF
MTTPEAPAAPAAREGSNKTDHETQAHPEAVRVLARLEDVDARLRLSGRQLRDLAPMASQWLARGYSAPEITDAVVQGLPTPVYSAAKIVADRLTRKLPAPRRKWQTFAECSDRCGRLLPSGQDSGQCGVCAGTTPAPFLQELAAQALQELAPAADTAPDVRAHVSNLRALMRSRRSAATA